LFIIPWMTLIFLGQLTPFFLGGVFPFFFWNCIPPFPYETCFFGCPPGRFRFLPGASFRTDLVRGLLFYPTVVFFFCFLSLTRSSFSFSSFSAPVSGKSEKTFVLRPLCARPFGQPGVGLISFSFPPFSEVVSSSLSPISLTFSPPSLV